MSEVNRLEMDHKGLPFVDENGVYVLYEDYTKIKAERDALAVECTQYKSLAERFAERADDYKSEHFGYSVFDSSNEFKQHIKTPATDARLNALRAEGLKMAIDHMNNQTSDNCADVTVLPVIEMYNQLRAGEPS